MTQLYRLLLVLFCVASFFLLRYVLSRPASPLPQDSHGMFVTHGDGVTWYRYRDGRVVQRLSAARATLFFAMAAQQASGTFPDFGAQPARVELDGAVQLAAQGHVLRTQRATLAEGIVSSAAAVEIVGRGVHLRGQDGFSYTLADGKLSLLGEVEGEAYPADRNR